MKNTVKVETAGAIGDGVADDTAHLQASIDQSPEGSTIDFGDAAHTYQLTHTLRLRPRRIYTGRATLTMSSTAAPGTSMMYLPYGSSQDVRIQGLTFNANYVGGILLIDTNGGELVPAKNIEIDGCYFQNTRANGQPWESAVYSPVGLQNSKIINNHFKNCGAGCLHLASPDHLLVSHNDFDTAGANAIFVALYPVTFAYGNNIEVSDNTGRHLQRMAIEFWGGAPHVNLNAPLIQDNVFRDWVRSSSPRDAFGISVAAGHAARILNNTLENGVEGYGIEAGPSGSIVENNKVVGFPTGIMAQGQADITIRGNHLINQTASAIFLSNAGSNRRIRILNNKIENPKNFGIGGEPNDYSGADISGNEIIRSAGFYPDDRTRTEPFIGIKLDAGLQGPIYLRSNKVIQTSTNPPAGFIFWGVGIFGGYTGSKLSYNTFESKSDLIKGQAFRVWSSGLLEGSSVANNNYINLKAGI